MKSQEDEIYGCLCSCSTHKIGELFAADSPMHTNHSDPGSQYLGVIIKSNTRSESDACTQYL